jgi:hypothetical protein
MSKTTNQSNKNKPDISFEQNIKTLSISGRSIQEDPRNYFHDLQEMTESEISKGKINSIILHFDYFNTSSAKYIYKFLENCIKIKDDLKITWIYDKDDEDMLEAGEDYQEMLKIKFTFQQAD